MARGFFRRSANTAHVAFVRPRGTANPKDIRRTAASAADFFVLDATLPVGATMPSLTVSPMASISRARCHPMLDEAAGIISGGWV